MSSYDPFASTPWPDDLPSRCPNCGHGFNCAANLKVGPGRLGRFFRWLAWWSMLPWIPAVFVLLARGMVASFGPGSGGGVAMVGLFLLPVGLFGTIALFMPNSRRVRCFACKYSRDFKALPKSLR
ncbi:hypothetical protein [Luteolibacter marinus]|uniref:hypothetical protein n=1 Tax=Luteolibacter marinus TaxID=2776705 RepID=UPI001865B5C8|nr:hypothetical protein [Luteolibacter marinus]